MDRNKIACDCRNVSYGKIEDAVKVSGCRSYEDVRALLKFGNGCGQCREFIQYMVENLLEDLKDSGQ